jgi:ribosomal protein S18 acetylase RimI-like enzyme
MTLNNNRKTKIKVMELRRRDFDEVVGNYYNAYDEVKRNPWLGINLFSEKPSIKDERKWFKDTVERTRKGDGFALVAEVDGKVVGISDVRNKTLQQEQRHVGVVGIYVLEGYRSLGIGSALLSSLIKTAKEQGKYEILMLSVFGNNKHAQNLYRKLGFAEFGRLPNGIKRNGEYTNEIHMYRRL